VEVGPPHPTYRMRIIVPLSLWLNGAHEQFIRTEFTNYIHIWMCARGTKRTCTLGFGGQHRWRTYTEAPKIMWLRVSALYSHGWHWGFGVDVWRT